MLKHLVLLTTLCTSLSTSIAQNTDTIIKRKNGLHIGIFASGGIGLVQFSNNNYITYLRDSTGSSRPETIYASPRSLYGASAPYIYPNTYDFNKRAIIASFAGGFDLWTNKWKWFHNIFCFNGSWFSGNYNYATYYKETDYNGFGWVYVHDTANAKYSQTELSIGYKLQPTYKFLFLSIGFACNFNTVNVTEQQNIRNDYWIFDERTFKNVYEGSQYVTSTTTNSLKYISVPFQFGIGAYLKYKKIVFKPAVNFMGPFSLGYIMYNFSLDVMAIVY